MTNKVRNFFEIIYRYALFFISAFSFLFLSSLLLNRQAMLNYDHKENYQAIAKLDLALKLNPFLFPAYFNLGNCYLDLEDYPHAADAYKKSIVLNPKNFEAYENLALVYSLQKEFSKSFAVLDEAKRRGGFSASMASLRNDVYKLYVAQTMEEGMDFIRKDNLEQAVERLKETTALAPEFALAYHNLGLVYFLQYRKVYTAENSFPLSYTAKKVMTSPKGRGIFLKGDLENALIYLKKSIELDPHNADAFVLLGEIMFQEKDFTEAALYFAQAASLSPDNAKIHNNLSLAYYRGDNYEEAIIHMRRAFALQPWNVTYWHALASILRDNGDYDEALEYFLGIAKKQPDIIELHSDIAGIYFLNGKVEEGRRELDEEMRQRQKKLSQDPDDLDSRLVLAKVYKDRAEYEKSQEVLNEILKRAPHLKEQVLDMAAVLESIMVVKKAESKEKGQLKGGSHDTVYLKNGRQIIGRVVHIDKDKVVLEIALPETVGTVTLNNRLIKKIERGS